MQFEFNFFQSKVARRIFLLFILSALIPVIFLAFFQIVQLNRQLVTNKENQIRQDVKNIGMELIGRLFNLENQLHILGRAYKYFPVKNSLDDPDVLIRVAPDYKALSYITKSKGAVALKGQTLYLPQGVPVLSEGSSWVINSYTNHNPNIMLLHKINTDEFLIGEVIQETLWDFDLKNNAVFWVLDADKKLIYSNSDIPVPTDLALLTDKNDTGTFTWEHNKQDYLIGYWNLFLQFRLNSRNWVIVLAQPQDPLFSQIKTLYQGFIPAILFALLISMLLSQSQIRRYLIPLEQLRDATRRLARRDFTIPVKVKSGDEFEELGSSFNRMAKQLNQQFQTLSLLSILDQSILKTTNGEKILSIIFEGLHGLVDYNLLILGQIKPNSTLELRVESAQEKSKILKTAISKVDLDNLKHSKEITLNLKIVSLPNYLSCIQSYPVNYLLIFPILHKKTPVAMICIGFENIEKLSECNTEELHDIFYRAAVAFTHVEWEDRLYHQAHYDYLTGLPNRLVLKDQLNQAVIRSEKNNTFNILMFLDLDNFKDINDTLGHGVGDHFLKMVAQAMQNSLVDNGIIARIGGDEFTILLTDIADNALAHQRAISTAETLLKVFETPFEWNNLEFHITASIGIVIAPDDSNKGEELIKFADMSMYKAKENGKNCYVFFSTTLEKMVRDRNKLLQEMHTAITEHQFIIYLQPKIDSTNKSLVGAEVLVRWMHPLHGLLLPDSFLPLAEESNLIIPIGEEIVRQACFQLKQWEKEYTDVPHLAINIAAKQFAQTNLAQQIKKIIDEIGIDATKLEFEITESSLIGNLNEAVLILNELHSLGSRLSIDDFGTGYSSMRYLQLLPLDNMKIDKVFIQDLLTDQRNVSIIKAIIALAESLNLALIAEGIESQMQSELLAELGCVVQQGFYFSEPLSPDVFANRYLKKRDQ